MLLAVPPEVLWTAGAAVVCGALYGGKLRDDRAKLQLELAARARDAAFDAREAAEDSRRAAARLERLTRVTTATMPAGYGLLSLLNRGGIRDAKADALVTERKAKRKAKAAEQAASLSVLDEEDLATLDAAQAECARAEQVYLQASGTDDFLDAELAYCEALNALEDAEEATVQVARRALDELK